MTQAAVEPLLAPIGEDAPSGQNLEYDADFLALERAAAAKAERGIGDSVKAAEEPDWALVATMAETLLGRSKDLRAAVHLSTAWLCTKGLPGFGSGLYLIRGLLEHFWDTVYPQLDADDNNDPTFRVNSLAALSDAQGVLRYLRATPFVSAARLGQFSLRDLRLANGTLKVSASANEEEGSGSVTLPTLAEIEGCCLECAEERLNDANTTVSEAFEHAKAIDSLFMDRVGPAGPDLKALLGDLSELQRFLSAQVKRRFQEDDTGAPGGDVGGETEVGDRRGGSRSSGAISSHADVIRRLDELCDYYARSEPASPVPLLLRRAKRLVGKDFADLIKDLAPDGMSQLEFISGVSANDDGGSGG